MRESTSTINRISAVWAVLAFFGTGVLSPALGQEPAGQSRAAIAGLVLDENSKPIAQATVILDSLRPVETDPAGRFHIDSVSPGSHRLVVRSIGFTPLSARLLLRPGTADVQVMLGSRGQVLPELSVKIRSPRLERVGYYARRDQEPGRFLEIDTLLRLDSINLLRGLTRLPGFRYRSPAGLDPGVASRACRGGFRLWVNGWEIPSPDQAFYLRTISPQELEAVEIYEDGTPPLIFAGSLPRPCVLAMWQEQ